MKILITVSGGVVNRVVSEHEAVEVILIDYDNLEAGEEDSEGNPIPMEPDRFQAEIVHDIEYTVRKEMKE